MTCETCKWWQYAWVRKRLKGESYPCFNVKSHYYPGIETKATDSCPHHEPKCPKEER